MSGAEVPVFVGRFRYRFVREAEGWATLRTDGDPSRVLGRVRAAGGRVVHAERDLREPHDGPGLRELGGQGLLAERAFHRAEAERACAAYALERLPDLAALAREGYDVRRGVLDDLAARVARVLTATHDREVDVFAEGAPRWNDAEWDLRPPGSAAWLTRLHATTAALATLSLELPPFVSLEGPLCVIALEGEVVRQRRARRRKGHPTPTPPTTSRQGPALLVGVRVLGAPARAVLVPLRSDHVDG